jgi:hypothetical protein
MRISFVFQVITFGGDSQEVVTEEVEVERIAHDEALPLEVSNSWFLFSVRSPIF